MNENEKPQTQPLAQVLATLPSGRQMPNLSPGALETYIRTKYLRNEAEKARRMRHRKRHELYQDGGVQYIDKLIDDTYKKAEIRERLKAWARIARFDNPLKRIVNELSTVYQKPAIRTVGGDADNKRYLEVQRLCRQDERSRQINRLLNVHRSLFVGFRIRAADERPVIDIVTPDQCFAVTHPNDSTLLVALIIETNFQTAVMQRNAPAYTVWTDHESFFLTKDGVIIETSYQPHGLGRMPYVYVSLEPATAGFWPGEVGEDLVGATLSAWFANTNLMKETKSASKFPVVSGDTSTTARDQAADSDEVVEVSEGTAITTVDTSMDLDLFIGTSDHTIEHAANNYGMSSAVIKHQGVQSAEARELMRAPMKELRQEQMIPLVEFERDLVELQALVLKAEGVTELAFSPEGWAIKFSELKTPLDPQSALLVFEKERQLGLTNTVDYLMETRGLSEDQAWEVLVNNMVVELLRNVLMRPQQEISGSPGATTPGTEIEKEPKKGEPPANDQQRAAA